MLTFAVAPIEFLPSWQAAFPDSNHYSGVDQELPETEGLIVEALAQSFSECEGDTTQIEELLSASDPAVVASFVRRVSLWKRALGCASEPLPWPSEVKDVWVHAVRRLPPRLPADFPREARPKF
jgi:hypothetical protein